MVRCCNHRRLMRFGLLLCALAWTATFPTVGAEESFTTALTGKFPPFSFYDSNGELSGFDVDVSKEIARRLGREANIVTIEWDGILAGLLAEKYDAIIGSMAITPEREERVLFSRPYYASGAQLFIHRDNPSKVYSINECDGLKIGVVLGETYQRHLEQKHPGIEVVTFKSTVEIFEMLEQNRITGFVTDRLVGSWQIQQAQRPFVPVGKMLYTERMGIAVRLQASELRDEIDVALAEMFADGTMDRIHQRYFKAGPVSEGTSGGMSPGVIAGKLLRGFGMTLTIAISSILIGFALAIPCGLLLVHNTGVWAVPHYLARWFVDFIRGTPVLVQLLFVWLGLGLRPITAAILTLGICAMAYMAEAVRSGLMSVDPGQGLAARALGLTSIDRFRFVIWPQAFRIAIPPLMNCVIALIKDTALVSIISIPELIREAQSIISVTFEPRLYYLIAGLMFFAVTFPMMKFSNRLENRIKAKGYNRD